MLNTSGLYHIGEYYFEDVYLIWGLVAFCYVTASLFFLLITNKKDIKKLSLAPRNGAEKDMKKIIFGYYKKHAITAILTIVFVLIFYPGLVFLAMEIGESTAARINAVTNHPLYGTKLPRGEYGATKGAGFIDCPTLNSIEYARDTDLMTECFRSSVLKYELEKLKLRSNARSDKFRKSQEFETRANETSKKVIFLQDESLALEFIQAIQKIGFIQDKKRWKADKTKELTKRSNLNEAAHYFTQVDDRYRAKQFLMQDN